MQMTVSRPFTLRGLLHWVTIRWNDVPEGMLRGGRTLTTQLRDGDFILDVDARRYIVRGTTGEPLHIELTREDVPLMNGQPLTPFTAAVDQVNPYDDQAVARLPKYQQHYAMCRRIRGADTLDEAILENGTLPLLEAAEAIGHEELAVLLRRVHAECPEADSMVDETEEELADRVEALCRMPDKDWDALCMTLSDRMTAYLIRGYCETK